MKITIPIRGLYLEQENVGYELLLSEISKQSGNPRLIALVDDQMDPVYNSRPIVEGISFEVLVGNSEKNTPPELVVELSKQHDFVITDFVYECLVIDLSLKNNSLSSKDVNYLEYSVNHILSRINLLLNLAYHTNVDFLKGVIYSSKNEYLGKTTEIISNLEMSYVYSMSEDWPEIRDLGLEDVIDWFHKFKVHPDDRSGSDVHRAINAFSRLFGDVGRDSSADLFWVMLGIESLLIEDNQNITSQFRRKSIMVLGEPKLYKKKLANLYNYRSRLIHGSYDIIPKFGFDKDEQFRESVEYLNLATAILIALIRELINDRKDRFSFEYRLI